MTFPSPGPRDDVPRPDPQLPGQPGPHQPGPGHVPGDEPADPWAEDEAQRRAQQPEGWTSEPGGLGPIPGRTWRRGTTRVTVGGCCLPLPIGCLTTLVAAGVAVAAVARRAG